MLLTKAVPTEKADARRALQKQREEEAEEEEGKEEDPHAPRRGEEHRPRPTP